MKNGNWKNSIIFAVIAILFSLCSLNAQAFNGQTTIDPNQYYVCDFNELTEHRPNWAFWLDDYRIEPPLNRAERLFYRNYAQKVGEITLYVSTDNNRDDAEVMVTLDHSVGRYEIGDTGVFTMFIGELDQPLLFFIPIEGHEALGEATIVHSKPAMNIGGGTDASASSANCDTDADVSTATAETNHETIASTPTTTSDAGSNDTGMPIGLVILIGFLSALIIALLITACCACVDDW